jgi:chromosome segregation ATPase
MEDNALRRIERVEERLNQAERDVATLTSKLTSTKDDLSRRLDEINQLLRDDAEKSRRDMRERLHELKADVRDDINSLNTTINTLSSNVSSVTDSLQNLYVSHKGSNTKVKTNEKVIWTILGIIGTVGLVLFQTYLKSKGG